MMAAHIHNPVICPVLIGGSLQHAALHHLIDQSKQGHGHVALLTGEAGIAKSRLAAGRSAEAAALGYSVVRGSCFPQASLSPYAPFLDLLRTESAQCPISIMPTKLNGTTPDLLQALPKRATPLTHTEALD